ncbi:MAG TPA: type II secretion system F family protein [Acidimicrobiales bacterium]|nr:type II secretion system F family protein [Acidimicrobiales bacterium]
MSTQIERALPEVLDDVAGALRSGRSLAEALDQAAPHATGPVATDLLEVVAKVARGAPLSGALDEWAGRRRLPSVDLAVAGLGVAAAVGGSQAAVVADLAASVRDRSAAGDELRAAATQARASAAVLVAAPVGFALFSGVVDPRTLAATVGRPWGLVSILVGLVLDVAGGWWMLRLSGRVR